MTPLPLPEGCQCRPATAADLAVIRRLVWQAKLDPTQIRWQQFWVIECDRQVIACGQLRTFAGAQELGSLVVAPQWRDRGLGTFLTQHLVQVASQPVYLECLGRKLAEFYQQRGFSPVAWHDLPKSLRRKFAISRLGAILIRLPVFYLHHTAAEATKKPD